MRSHDCCRYTLLQDVVRIGGYAENGGLRAARRKLCNDISVRVDFSIQRIECSLSKRSRDRPDPAVLNLALSSAAAIGIRHQIGSLRSFQSTHHMRRLDGSR